MVIGLLGVLQAGGAFVPLDPQWPAAPPSRRHRGRPGRPAAQRLGRARPRANRKPSPSTSATGGSAPTPPRRPTSTSPATPLAYVIFTSGSTGRPKGAMIRHEAISERLLWQVDEILRLRPRRRVAVQGAAVLRHLRQRDPAAAGVRRRTVVVAEPGGERDPQYLLDLIAERAGHVRLPGVVDAGRAAGDRPRHRPAGRPASTSGAAARCSPRSCSTGSAPSSTPRCTTATARPRRPSASRTSSTATRPSGSPTSIGRPNPHTQLYVLDDELRPVPGRRRRRAVRRRVPAGPRLRQRARPDRRPGSSPTRSTPTAPGCTAPATWRGGPPDGVAGLPRPRRQPGQDPRDAAGAGGGRGRPRRAPRRYGTPASSCGRTRPAAPTSSATSIPPPGART